MDLAGQAALTDDGGAVSGMPCVADHHHIPGYDEDYDPLGLGCELE